MRKKYKIRMLQFVSIGIFALVCLCTQAYAHYPWINVVDYTPEVGRSLKLTIGWGHSFRWMVS
jgi:hypothetical protein